MFKFKKSPQYNWGLSLNLIKSDGVFVFSYFISGRLAAATDCPTRLAFSSGV